MVPISELRKPGLRDDSEWSAQGASMKTRGQAHIRTQAWWCTRGRDRWVPRVHWPDSLDYLASSRPKRDPASKHSKDGPWGPMVYPSATDSPPPTHTHRVPRENRVISTQRVEALGCPVPHCAVPVWIHLLCDKSNGLSRAPGSCSPPHSMDIILGWKR